MATVKADEVRIPRRAREAVAKHEKVVVMNRERATFVILHPADDSPGLAARGRRLGDALAVLAQSAPPDASFTEDMEAVLEAIGPSPADPWARS
jgi:hypothetical protein